VPSTKQVAPQLGAAEAGAAVAASAAPASATVRAKLDNARNFKSHDYPQWFRQRRSGAVRKQATANPQRLRADANEGTFRFAFVCKKGEKF